MAVVHDGLTTIGADGASDDQTIPEVRVVAFGSFGQQKNRVYRNIPANPTAPLAFTWSTVGPKEVEIFVRGGAAGDVVRFCFDAPSVYIAEEWLSAGDTFASADCQFEEIETGTSRVFTFRDPISTIHMWNAGSGTPTVFVSAA